MVGRCPCCGAWHGPGEPKALPLRAVVVSVHGDHTTDYREDHYLNGRLLRPMGCREGSAFNRRLMHIATYEA